MKGILGKWSKKKVFYIPITKVDNKAKEKIDSALASCSKKNTAALLVGVNLQIPTSNHSPVMTDIIGQSLRAKAKELEVPLITSAEEMALGSGFQLLSYGDKVLVNECSFLGNIGFAVNPWNLKEFSKHYNFSVEFIHKGKNKMRLNRFQDFTQADIDWLLNILNKRVDAMSKSIIERRAAKIPKESSDQVLLKLKQGHLFKNEEARDLGLIDEIINPDDYCLREFKDAEIAPTSKNWKQQLGLQAMTDLSADFELSEQEILQEIALNFFWQNNLKSEMPLF